ncbi:MAG: hypothetical protein ABI400_12990 [Lacisediminihabitans sp.]
MSIDPRALTLPTEHTRERMIADFSWLRHRKTRNHRIAVAGVVIALALGSTAGGLAIARATQAVINNSAECYASASTSSAHFPSVNAAGNPNAKTAIPISQQVSQAIDACGASWRIGSFEADQAHIPAGKEFLIPTLVACRLADGRIGVFPSDASPVQACARLNLATPTRRLP